MRKNKKSCSISEFCRNNNFRTLEFYKMLSRHPELARKMKANSAGERVLDEEANYKKMKFPTTRVGSRLQIPKEAFLDFLRYGEFTKTEDK